MIPRQASHAEHLLMDMPEKISSIKLSPPKASFLTISRPTKVFPAPGIYKSDFLIFSLA
jgi:hypothetical protein